MPPIDTAETVFPAVPESVAATRRFTRAALGRHAVETEIIETAALLVSELATNAVVHATSDIRLRVRVGHDIRIEVADVSAGVPMVTTGDLERESGRGLALVASLAATWDWAPRQTGKVVWFALDRG